VKERQSLWEGLAFSIMGDMEPIKIRWSQVGSPKQPETYRVQGVGDVKVQDGDITRYNEIGGDPWIDLYDATELGHSVKTYLIGHFTPA